MNDSPSHAPQSADPGRASYYRRIDRQNLAPLWEVLHALVPAEPVVPCDPAIWRWEDVRPQLMEAGRLITAEEAIRRVLILENPAMRGQSLVTPSLYAGLQLILPGEVAPSHRHTQSALRFVVEGSGAYTAVDGERTTMHPGDFIITPAWTWHDHGHAGVAPDAGPVTWLDGLDIPIIRMFGATFAENFPQASQPVTKPEGHSTTRYAHNLLPVDFRPDRPTSPIFSYPYARSREALDRLRREEDPHPWLGHKLRYANPATGSWAMPTMATFLQWLPKGFAGKPFRSTDGTVYSVVEGSGRVTLTRGRRQDSFHFGPRDHFVVPPWTFVRFDAPEDCVLFSFSDRPLQAHLGLLREEFEDMSA
jgi:gentisate 1,2-dioxygenase